MINPVHIEAWHGWEDSTPGDVLCDGNIGYRSTTVEAGWDGWTTDPTELARVTCPSCLRKVVALGEAAAARLRELEKLPHSYPTAT